MANTNSISLNGSSQYLTRASTTYLSLNSDFTLEAWIYMNNLPSTDAHGFTIIAKGDDASCVDYRMYIDNSDDKLHVAYENTSGTNGTYAYRTTAFNAGDLNTWIHVAVTVDISAATMVIFINGISVGVSYVGQTATSMNTSSVPFYVGARDYSADRKYFDGLIDEVRVWNDIRTTQEIFANYRKELIGSEAGLVGYWKFNNSTRDSTGFGNTLTLVGSPTYSTPAFTSETVVFYTRCLGWAGWYDGGTTHTWAASRAHTGNYTDANPALVYAGYVAGYTQLHRNYFHFDTSSLPDDATLTSGSFNFYGLNASGNLHNYFPGDLGDIVLIKNTSAVCPTTSASYQEYIFTNLGELSHDSFHDDNTTVNTVLLNSEGINFISKTADTKLGLTMRADLSDTDPGQTGNNGFLHTFSGAKQPYLEVTYTTSSTTDVFRTGAGDGRIGLDCTGMSWATCRNAATGSLASPTDSPQAMTYAVAPNGYIQRGFFPVDTNSLPSGAVISAATLNIYATDLTDTTLDGYDYGVVVQTTQPDHTTFTTADYDLFGTTKGSADLSYNGIQGTNKWVAFTLNSTGIGWIKKAGAASTCGTALTGWTCLGTRCGNDLDNVEPPASPKLDYLTGNYSESGTNSPYLAITYTTFDLQRQNIINGLTTTPKTVAALVVAGGGGGGADGYSGNGAGEGGGGAGGLLYNAALPVDYTSYTVTVGAGGAGGARITNTYVTGDSGKSSIFHTISTTGGGGGGNPDGRKALPGGSGGGSGPAGIAGDADYLNPRQGYDGSSSTASGAPYAGGGGGGSSEPGHPQVSNSVGGAGGAGTVYDIVQDGVNVTYAAGGKGADGWLFGNGASATANTGNGGDGGGNGSGGNGGSGIVVIRYLTADFGTCTGGTKTTDGDYTVHKFLLADSGTNMTFVNKQANGWNTEVKAKAPVTDVVRTSDTITTITLSAQAAYNITSTENVTSIVLPTTLGQTMNTNSLNLVTASSQYAMRAGQNCNNLSGFTSMTWEFWVKFDIIGVDYNLVSKNYRPLADNSRSYNIGFSSANKMALTVTDDGTASSGHFRQYYADVATTVVGAWQHYAVSYNGSTQTLVVIKDGSTVVPMTLIDGTGCTHMFDNPTADLQIGGYNDIYYIDGLMNEVRIWSDVRTPAEIQANYTKQLLGTEANLEGYWRLNNNGLDLTVNGNDLTLVNSPTYSTDVPFTCGTDIVAAPTFDITGGSAGPANVKTFLGLASASAKTLNGLAIASVKTWDGIA
jgi:hypothetical protein